MTEPHDPPTDSADAPQASPIPPEVECPSPPPATAPRPSMLRLFKIIVPVVLLAAVIGFGWALGWHEPIVMALFKPELVEAGGRITLNGKPVEYGTVMTLPDSSLSEPAIGVLGEGGTFTLRTNGVPGAAVGTHRVAVMASTSGFPPRSLLPVEYGDAVTSPLVIEVSSDLADNKFELEMTGEAPARPESDEPAGDEGGRDEPVGDDGAGDDGPAESASEETSPPGAAETQRETAPSVE